MLFKFSIFYIKNIIYPQTCNVTIDHIRILYYITYDHDPQVIRTNIIVPILY